MTDWNRLAYAESRYREVEPWEYSQRGVELLRHLRLVELARDLHAARTLDLGCSLGQLTRKLAALPGGLCAVDLSPTAVARARENVRSEAETPVDFAAARSLELPFRDGSFDLVIAADGLYSWDIEREERATALGEIDRILSIGGHAILTEHMRPRRFREFIGEIESSRLGVESIVYFYDRPAYQLEGWLKAVRHWPIATALGRSVVVARGLSCVGRLFGTRGARHVCVVARKS